MFVVSMLVFKCNLSSFYLSSKLREAATQEAEMLLQMPPVLEEREEINTVLSDDRTLQGLETANIVFTDISYGLSERVNCKCFYDSNHTKELFPHESAVAGEENERQTINYLLLLLLFYSY